MSPLQLIPTTYLPSLLDYIAHLQTNQYETGCIVAHLVAEFSQVGVNPIKLFTPLTILCVGTQYELGPSPLCILSTNKPFKPCHFTQYPTQFHTRPPIHPPSSIHCAPNIDLIEIHPYSIININIINYTTSDRFFISLKM